MIIKFYKEHKNPAKTFFFLKLQKETAIFCFLRNEYFGDQANGLASVQQPSVRTCPGISSPEQCGCSGHDCLQGTGQAVEVGTSSISAVSHNLPWCYKAFFFWPFHPHPT